VQCIVSAYYDHADRFGDGNRCRTGEGFDAVRMKQDPLSEQISLQVLNYPVVGKAGRFT
jgi:hypothetical protein